MSYPPPGRSASRLTQLSARRSAGEPPPSSGPAVQLASPSSSMGAVTSVVVRLPGPTIPLNKLAPEAALRRLELTIVRRLEGFLHGDHLGLLPGPGWTSATPGCTSRRGRCAQD